MGSYAGVDWAAEKHDVFVADAAGEKQLAATFAHDEQGPRSLCRQPVRLRVELVAFEGPDGLLVERGGGDIRVVAQRLQSRLILRHRDRRNDPRLQLVSGYGTYIAAMIVLAVVALAGLGIATRLPANPITAAGASSESTAALSTVLDSAV
jgi:hypothetical protein